MSIIKETITYNSTGSTITFGLSGGNRIIGYQQEIDYFSEEIKEELHNPIVDSEVCRFQYKPSIGGTTLKFYFGNSLSSNFTSAGFTLTEIRYNDIKLQNSFFILDFYDNFNTYTQTKIFTTYLTKILDSSDLTKAEYVINLGVRNQFYSMYVPQSFISGRTGTINGYVRFSFYNAKTGKISSFYNYSNAGITTPERNYFKTTLDFDNMTWRFTSLVNAKAYEFPSNNSYVNKLNNTINNFDDKKQNYPTGNTFVRTDGSYETT